MSLGFGFDLAFLAAALVMGFTVGIISAIRIMIGRRVASTDLAIIAIDSLLSINAIAGLLAVYLWSIEIRGGEELVDEIAIFALYLGLSANGIVTAYRLALWWSGGDEAS